MDVEVGGGVDGEGACRLVGGRARVTGHVLGLPGVPRVDPALFLDAGCLWATFHTGAGVLDIQ